MSDTHIPVRPSFISGSPVKRISPRNVNLTKNSGEKMDPDFKRVLENNYKASKTKHQPTKEEQTATESSGSSISWIVIVFAIIIVVLIIAIVWLVLKKNDETDKELQEAVTPATLRETHHRQPRRRQAARRTRTVSFKEPVEQQPVRVPKKPEQVEEDSDEEVQEEPSEVKTDDVEDSDEDAVCEPKNATATEEELFEILEGDNRKYAKKKLNAKKPVGKEEEEEEEMISNYYNEIQDSDEEKYDADK